VLEAERIGHGGSGRNVGLVNAGVWHPPAAVRAALGPTYGPRFVERFGAAPEYVFSLIENIRSAANRRGTARSTPPTRPRRLRGCGRHDEWRRLGAPVEMLSAEEARAMIGGGRLPAGSTTRRAGTVNPMGYVRGLARAALGAGARIATGVRATGLARDGDGWRVTTNRGNVRARTWCWRPTPIPTTSGPASRGLHADPLFPAYHRAPRRRRDTILPGRQGLWDTAQIMTSLRKDRPGG
jgi:glycine/D-amino acid oxidase-like deaminating enzyme